MARQPRICATCGVEYEHDALFCPKDGTPLGSSRNQPGEDPYIGQVISEQIEIRQLVGIGSMGRVYRAWQRGVERDVAVKLLHRELSANSALVARFLREARIASRLQHPNVVQVLMAGQLPSQSPTTGDELYIVMEYLDGISLLSALAASAGAMPLPRALHLALQICDAVGEAHAQGIVHRDLKPENVVLVRRGDDPDFAKVLDFGIARLDWGQGSVATQAGLIFGTARYISPEGARGEAAGPQADVYSIATILYQCLAGRTPFENDSPMALLMMHTYEAPPQLTSVPRASYVPAPLAAAIMRNLEKSPEHRAPDARALGRLLVEAARASGLSPDDLVPRSTLLGQRPGTATSFTSLERTKQHGFSERIAGVIAAHNAAQAASPQVSDPPQAAPVDSSPSQSTVMTEPSSDVLATPPPGDARASRASLTATPLPQPSSPALPTVHGTARTLDDDDELPSTARRNRARAVLVVLACFLAGAGAVSLGAHRLGFLGGQSTQSAASFAQRAEAALQGRRWSTPPGDNVRDLTNEGLRRHPGNRELLDLRRRAAQELVSSSLGRKYGNDIPGALADARLALELAPDNTTAQHLISELQALVGDGGPPIIAVDSVDAPIPDKPPGTKPPRNETRQPPRTTAGTTTGGAAVSPPTSSAPDQPPAPTNTSGRWL